MESNESLRTGIAEMRSVAQRLSEWADRLEERFLSPAGEAGQGEAGLADSAPAAVPVSAEKRRRRGKVAEATEVVASPVEPAVTAAAPVTDVPEVPAPVPVPAPAPAAPEPPTFEQVRGLLAGKSAAGYRAQVLALIRSYGAEKLSEVDPAHYGELVEAAGRFGAGAGGGRNAG